MSALSCRAESPQSVIQGSRPKGDAGGPGKGVIIHSSGEIFRRAAIHPRATLFPGVPEAGGEAKHGSWIAASPAALPGTRSLIA